MSARDNNMAPVGSATVGVRDTSGPSNSSAADEDKQESPGAAQEQASSPTFVNGGLRVVSFASGMLDDSRESSISPETELSNVGYQSVGISAAGHSYITTSPTAIENSPTSTFSISNPLLDEEESIGSLKQQLNKALIESKYGETRSFLPRSEADRLVRPEIIRSYWLKHVDRQFHGKVSDVIDYVCGKKLSKHRKSARLVFSIFVFIDEPALILDVIKDNVCDDDLPLVCVNKQGTDFQLARSTDESHPIKCFDEWRIPQRFTFESLQWRVKAPVFPKLRLKNRTSELPVITFDDRAVLPFTEYDSKNKYNGNSEVVQVKIHPAHHCFDPEKNQSFALKSLKSEDLVGFLLEAKALAKVKPKKHLVSVLAAFKYQNKYHLLFRWADGGNLQDFWSQMNPVADYESVCWLAEQCYGLVDGLDGIHNAKLSESEVVRILDSSPSLTTTSNGPSENVDIPTVKGDDKDCGRHGDIKPQNILWFKQDENQYGHGVLKISDFGLTTFHSELTTKVPSVGPMTFTYAAPERDIASDLSRPFDIWSLGCVYLEFITWFLLGRGKPSEFQKRRIDKKDDRTKFQTDEFYSVYRNQDGVTYATVKEPVTEVSWPTIDLGWELTLYPQLISCLKGEPECSRFLFDFLDYIERKMLVIDKTQRDKCSQVKKQLKDLFNKCRNDRTYAVSSSTELDVQPISSSRGVLAIQGGTLGERTDRASGKENHLSIKDRVKRKLRDWCF